jgi:pyruvate dehydrogenase E2 component (dihydrolipoamide acetyltransferase)
MTAMSTRRKLAIATWSAPREGNIYGKLTLDAGPALAYLEAVRARTGRKVTLTHLVGRAVGLALKEAPGLNGRLLWGTYTPHPTVDVAFLVAIEDGKDLAKVKVPCIDTLSVAEIADRLSGGATALRTGRDAAFEKSRGPLKALPTWLIRPLVWFTGWLTSSLGVSVPALGLEAFPFGACIITSVGMFGLDEGYAPPTPWARVPIYVLMGAVRDMPAVVDGQVVVQKQVTITATIDHRFLDGAQGAVLARKMREVFADPAAFDAPA